MTKITKNRIKKSFNKAKLSYDLNDHVQRGVCQRSIEILKLKNNYFRTVSDFACGTGNSTLKLIENIRYEKMIAVDFSDRLIEVAKEKLGRYDIEFILGDFDDKLLPIKSHDLIFCNMGLQWSLNLRKTLEILLSYLNEQGFLVFSIPLDGTFKELKRYYRNTLYSDTEIKVLLEQLQAHSIEYHHVTMSEHYDAWIDAVRSIKGVGANCLLDLDRLDHAKVLIKSADDYFLENEKCALTYQVGIFIASK